MLKEPKHGWTEFKFGNFSCTPSYLTNVPEDMLACAFSFLMSRIGQCYFDCEGTSYTFVMSVDGIYLICLEDELSVKDVTPDNYFSKDYARIFAKEVIEDIEKYIDKWANWDPYTENPQYAKNNLKRSITNLNIWMKIDEEQKHGKEHE